MALRPKSLRQHMRRVLAPPYKPPPADTEVSEDDEERWSAYDASCRFCAAPLRLYGCEFPKGFSVNMVCCATRVHACVDAALEYLQQQRRLKGG